MTTFAIAGLFRSGTRFLADNMNLSPTWTVRHEVDQGPVPVKMLKRVQARFNRQRSGEVSHRLIPFIDKLKVGKRGIVLRHPVPVWLSIVSWREGLIPERAAKQAATDLRNITAWSPQLLDLAATGRYRLIEFDRMTTDREYLERVFRDFGVDDVDVTDEMVRTKIHASTVPHKALCEFDQKTRDAITGLAEHYEKALLALRGRGLL